ncbi:MAG: hypothetical protein JSU70_01215 [Phycisphaerales bacterium]|nr:MAG: hypothetical protein JSU70_01215 [Phycisphaerales bacterium]
MSRLKWIVLIVSFIVLFHTSTGCCEPMEREHEHAEHGGHDRVYELGVSTGFVRMEPEGQSAVGTHLHLIRRFQGEDIRRFFGLGIGFETVFADHTHYNVMGTIAVYPYKNLSIGISPGVLIVEHDNECELCYSTHVEVAYVFEIGQFHVGPVAGYAKSGDDEHYFVGIHLGRGFQ